MTFAVYAERQGAAALWQETQNVSLDDQGVYKHPARRDFETWRKKRAPGSNEAVRAYVRSMAEAAKAKSA